MTNRRLVSALLVVTSLAASIAPLASWSSSAHAEELSAEQVEKARAAFKEGLAAEKEGDYVKALARFEVTAAIKLTPPVRFHLALCQEKLNRWVEALENYELAGQEAEEKNVAEVKDAAPKLAEKLRARIPRLLIEITATRPDEVELDGRVLTPTKYSAPILVDPGKHVIVARLKGQKNFASEITLAESEKKTVAIAMTLPILPDEDQPPPRPVSLPPERPSSGSTQRTVGFIVGGFGIVALGTSAIFYGMRVSKVNDLDAQCPDLKCPSSAADKVDAAKTDTTISRIALGVGVVSLGVGAYLVLTAKSSGAESAPPPVAYRPRFVPYVPNAPNALAGFGFEGAF
jgi:hypothetical protein